MALLAVSYGACHEACRTPRLAQLALGGLFGLVAALQMSNALPLADGVIVDLRNLVLTLAGAFLGWPGAAVSVAMAAAARLYVGGVGTVAGCTSIILAAASGLVWATLESGERRGWHRFLILGLVSSALSYGLICVLLPTPIAIRFLTVVWPTVSLIHVPAVVLIGCLLERERRRLSAVKRLQEEARRDPLTGLLNRRGFDLHVATLRPGLTSAGLLLIDMDHFKRVNDTHGHAVGDEILREMGQLLMKHVPAQGAVARLGGEEFGVHVREITADMTFALANNLCTAVRGHRFASSLGRGIHQTVSVGVTWAGSPSLLRTLLAQADLALYAAKTAGRNRVVTYLAVAETFGPDGTHTNVDERAALAPNLPTRYARGLRAAHHAEPMGWTTSTTSD